MISNPTLIRNHEAYPMTEIALPPLTLRTIEPLVYRVPLETPVRTSFGIMHDRPALLLRVTDADGVEGWGEVWCNFPAVGAEHRARLVQSVLAPLALGKAWRSPQALFQALTQQTAVLAIQSGEPGRSPTRSPVSTLPPGISPRAARACPCGSCWAAPPDRSASMRAASTPTARSTWPASGRPRAHRLQAEGRLRRRTRPGQPGGAARGLGAGAMLMVDANQAWSSEQAIAFCRSWSRTSWPGWRSPCARTDPGTNGSHCRR